MTLTLLILGHDFAYEMECVTRIFFAGAKINVVKYNNLTDENSAAGYSLSEGVLKSVPLLVTLVEQVKTGKLRLTVRTVFESDVESNDVREISAGDSGLTERTLATMLFTLLSAQTGKRPPWGILTGIRPVRLCGLWGEQGLGDPEIVKRLSDEYLVSPEKASLCIETGNAQREILLMNKPDTFSLYVSIPFCPTRCLYCSFVSHAIDKAARLLPDYIRLLCEEIRHIGRYAEQKKLRLLSVYIGGGTPTVLEAAQLKQILEVIAASFDFSHLLEYTVEAGRPDTITQEKLEVLQLCGVDRISVNPQSMNDNVLNAIGRRHTSEQTVKSIVLAKSIGFKSINMDLIAGLPEESPESFEKSLDKVLTLSPDNITVHTLTVKRSSHLRERNDAFSGTNPGAAMMLNCAAKKIRAAGYFPYYLYRQKATVENLENIGFSRPEHVGVYNIFSMEDKHNILAAGAGGVSKLIENGNLRRIFNFKYPYEYISRFDEVINRKTEDKPCAK